MSATEKAASALVTALSDTRPPSVERCAELLLCAAAPAVIQAGLVDGKPDRVAFLTAVLRGCAVLGEHADKAEAAADVHIGAVGLVLQQIAALTLSDRAAELCLGAVSDSLASLPLYRLPDVTDAALSAFARWPHPRLLGLCASAISLACSSPAGDALTLRLPGGAELRPSAFRAQTISDAISAVWPPKQAASLGFALADAPLTAAQKDGISAKLLHAMRGVTPADLPALAHQALRVSADKPACLAGLVAHFDWREARVLEPARGEEAAAPGAPGPAPPAVSRALRQTEGTVLTGIFAAASQDEKMGEVACARAMGGVKLAGAKAAGAALPKFSEPSPAHALSPFGAAVLLTLARCPRLEAAALAALRGAVLGACREAERREACAWAASLRPLPLQGGGGCGGVAAALRVAAQRAADGDWEPLAQPLVALGEGLLACADEAARGGLDGDHAAAALAVVAARAEVPDASGPPLPQPLAAACLGYQLLAGMYAAHAPSRPAIVHACQASMARSAAAPSRACLHSRLLLHLCRAHPGAVDGQLAARLRDSFEYAALISPPATAALLFAARPLRDVAPQLLVHANLCLRKALFAGDGAGRTAAVKGLLHLIMIGREAAAGQGGAMQASQAAPELLAESAFLRRCLGQQPAVREALYRGLAGMARLDAAAASVAASLLLPHLLKHRPKAASSAAADEDGPPPALLLGGCVSGGDGDGEGGEAVRPAKRRHASLTPPQRLLEPLDVLFRCCADIVACNPSGGGAAMGELRSRVGDVCSALLAPDCDEMQFDLGPNAVLSSTHAVGRRNVMLAEMLVGCMEVAIEATVEEAAGGGATPGAVSLQVTRAVGLIARLTGRISAAEKAGKAESSAAARSKRKAAKAGASADADAPAPPAKAGKGAPPPPPPPPCAPLLSPACIARLLLAKAQDGLRGGAGRCTDEERAAVSALARSTTFGIFAFTAARRTLEAARGPAGSEHAWLRALAEGSAADEAAADALGGRALGDWRQLGAPLLKVTFQLLSAAAASRGSGGADKPPPTKRAKKVGVAGGAASVAAAAAAAAAAQAASEAALPLNALKASSELLRLCVARGGAGGVSAAVLMLRDAFSAAPAAAASDGGGESSDDEDAPPAPPPPPPVAAVLEADSEAGAAAIASAVKKVQDLADKLLAAGAELRAECELLLRLLSLVLGLLPPSRAAAARAACCAWATRALRAFAVADSACVRLLTSLAVSLRPPGDDLRIAASIASELKLLLGGPEVEADGGQLTYGALRLPTAGGAALALFAFAEAELEAVEWLLGSARALDEAADADATRAAELAGAVGREERADEDEEEEEGGEAAAETGGGARRHQLRQRADLLAAAHTRLRGLASLIDTLLSSHIPVAVSDELTKAATRVLRCSAVAVSSAIAPPRQKQAPPTTQLRALVWALHEGFVASMGTFILRMEEDTGTKGAKSKKRKQAADDAEEEEEEEEEEKGGQKPTAATAAQVRKGCKHLPNLVKVHSDFEARVLALEAAVR